MDRSSKKPSKSQKKSLDHPEFLSTVVRVGDEGRWRGVDDLDELDDFRPQGGEGVSYLQITASIAEKGPPLGENYLPGYGGPTLRQVQFWVRVPQDEHVLAFVLLYCWQLCIDLKPVTTIKDSLAELARVAASKGWVTLSDVIKETRKLNTGGRPRGAVKKDTTKFGACFMRLKSANPQLSDMAILEKVAAETGRSGWGKEKKDNHRTKVKKALQRVGLLPVTPRKTSGQ